MIADSVVCGDAYIISGQSNSHASSSFSTFSSPWCRSFGVKTGYETYELEDKKVRWGRATGNAPGLKKGGAWFVKNPLGVGVWGMELMRLIVEKHQVPVCIINGGSGSSSIEQNMLYPEQPSLETSFGRLAYRVDQAGLKDHIKTILWHQGETNSNSIESYQSYATNFDGLLKDWRRVYPGLTKIYLFQLHPGCGGEYQSEIREIQQRIASKYEMAHIMSTTGVSGHDGCHFSYQGYLEFAERIFPFVSRDFYGLKPDGIITPPKLLSAKYNADKEIVLEFDQPIKLEEQKQVNDKVHELKDQFFFVVAENGKKQSGVVENIQENNQQLVLTLDEGANYHQITYLPNRTYSSTEDVYAGPWIRSKDNDLGALSFDRRTIIQHAKSGEVDGGDFHGFAQLDSTLNGINFKLVFPKLANQKRNWIWRARFWGHEAQTDIALLEHGFHVAYIDVAGLFGSQKAIRIWDDFYELMTEYYDLNTKVVLEGMSRGGLIVLNWGNLNAEKVAAIYVDAPVSDFKSWPGGKGASDGNQAAWQSCLEEYGFSEEVAMHYNGNPIDHLENLSSQMVPILSVVGDADDVVPISENTELLERRLTALGWKMTTIHKPGIGHHPHSLENPAAIVDFILKSTIKR